MNHKDIKDAAAAVRASMRHQKAQSIPGALYDGAGNVVATKGQYTLIEDEPRDDEKVYMINEAFPGPQKLGFEPNVMPGYIMATFRVPGGDPSDCGLLFFKGTKVPPEGTMFAIRMLAPKKEKEDAKHEDGHASSERRQSTPDAQGQTSSPSAPSSARQLVQNPEAAAILKLER